MSPRVRRIFDAADQGHVVPIFNNEYVARSLLEQIASGDVNLTGYTFQDDVKGGLFWIFRNDLVA